MSTETRTLGAERSTTELFVGRDGETLPLQDVVTGRGFITGKSGAGKSHSGGVLVEELLDLGIPVVVLDPDGEHAAITSEYDVLHAGPATNPETDLTLTQSNASRVVATAYRERIPVVLDLTGIFGEDAQNDLVASVCRRLFQLATREKAPMLLLLEELHEWAPNRGGGDTHDTIIKIAKRGRKHGLGVVGLTQRPADASKGFITQADWLAWHRLTWSNDLDVVGEVLGREYPDQVEALDTGEALLQADWNDDVRPLNWRPKRTPDNGSAPDAHNALHSAGAITDELLDELHAENGDAEDDQSGTSCDNCPFCSAGVEPPAQLADAVTHGDGDVRAVRAVQRLDTGRHRVIVPGDVFKDTSLYKGDTVSVGFDEDGVRLWSDDRGVLTYTVQEKPAGTRIFLTERALGLLAVEAGDYVQVVETDGDGHLLERVTDRVDAPDYPILGCKQPYTTKTDGDGADSVHYGEVFSHYLDLDRDGDRITVRDTGEKLVVVPGNVDGVATYKIADFCGPYIGAKGLSPLGAVDGDELVARPDGPRQIAITVRKTEVVSA